MLSMYIASRRAQSSQPIGSLAPHEDYVLGTNSGRIDEDETFGWGRGGDVFCFKPLNGHHVLQVLIHPHKTQLSLSIPPPSSPWMMTVYSPKKWNQPLENGYHRIQQTYRETNISCNIPVSAGFLLGCGRKHIVNIAVCRPRLLGAYRY